jgi:hypothetical protein
MVGGFEKVYGSITSRWILSRERLELRERLGQTHPIINITKIKCDDVRPNNNKAS